MRSQGQDFSQEDSKHFAQLTLWVPSSVNTRNSGSVFTSLTTVPHKNKCRSRQWFSAHQESSSLAFPIRLQALNEILKKPMHRAPTAEPQRLPKNPFILAVSHNSYSV